VAEGFKDRQVKVLPFTPGDSEQEVFSPLDEIVTRSAKQNGTRRPVVGDRRTRSPRWTVNRHLANRMEILDARTRSPG
jgi:hypothetical protein